MRNELVIGTDKPSSLVGITSLWYMADASENTDFYIFYSNLTGIRLYVYKDSKEGAKLNEWLKCEENRNNDIIQRKALELILPHLTVNDFYQIIDREKSNSWDAGYKKAQLDIRKALGV